MPLGDEEKFGIYLNDLSKIRFIDLCLSDDENGIVKPRYSRDFIDIFIEEEIVNVIEKKQNILPLVLRKRRLIDNKKQENVPKPEVQVLPITLRKKLLIEGTMAS